MNHLSRTTAMPDIQVKYAVEDALLTANKCCHSVMDLPYKERCDFVWKTEDCGADEYGLINPFYLIFCHFKEERSYLGIILTVFGMALIFVTTAFVADGYLCTNLAVISRSLKLPDSIAGVTLLALGNGIPDLFTAFAGAELNHPEILFAGLTGAGLFDVTIAAGCVIFVRPFIIDAFSWWNLIFYLCSYAILFSGFYYRNLSVWHSVGMLFAYSMYGVFTVGHFFLGSAEEEEDELEEEDEEHLIKLAKAKTMAVPRSGRGTLQSTVELLKAMERSKVYRMMGYRHSVRRSGDFGYSWRRPKHLLLEFYDFLDFRVNYDWYQCSPLQKFFIVLQVPWIIGLKLLIPAVLPDISVNDGWCKLLAMINSFVYFNLLFYCFGVSTTKIGPFALWQYAIVPGIIISTFIFFTSRTSMKPNYHTVFAYAGFIAAIATSRLLCTEIVVCIQAIGARLAISNSWLALTVLAWGNSVTDIVSASSLSRQGLQNMGFSSLYGGPMFNCSVGVALVCMAVYFEGKPLVAFYGAMGPVGALFLMIALVSMIVLMPIINFEGRRVVGVYLITLYIMFFILCILMETIIHPFGTQYIPHGKTT